VIKGEEEPIKYGGKLGHELLTKFLNPHAPAAKEQPPPEEGKSKSKPKQSKPAEPEPEPETGEIYEIRDQATFDTRCANKGGLCAIAVLDPENTDEPDQKNYIATLTKLGEQYQGRLRILYLDALAQTDFTKKLDIPQQYPSIVALNPGKLRYSPFMGTFEEESLSEFFDLVLRGKKSFAYTAPAIVDQSAEPPKKPRQPQPAEEETETEEKEKDEL